MSDRRQKNLYGDEISLLASAEIADYVRLNLQKIQARRMAYSCPVIAIAGAEGKTSTKRMISAVLSKAGRVLETPLDCDNAVDVSNTLLQMDDRVDFVLLELGMINARQFELAVQIAQPNVAVITNIGETSSPQVGDKFQVASTHLELIRNLPLDGLAVLNLDDELVSDMSRFAPTERIVKFGLNKGAHYFASQIEYLGPSGTRFMLNDREPFHMPVYCSASVYNALAAIAVCRELGIALTDIRQGLENDYAILQGRGNLVPLHEQSWLLDYSYDCTVNSLPRACEALVQFRHFTDHLTLIIGDMRDASGNGIQAHLNAGFYLSALPINTVITVGEKARFVAEGIKRINHTRKKLYHFSSPQELAVQLADFVKPNSAMLITGSREQNMGQLVLALRPMPSP